MKNFKSLILSTIMLMILLSTQVFAAFSTGDFVFVAYHDEGNSPVGSEILASFTGLNLNAQSATIAAAGTITPTKIGDTDWSLMKGGMYMAGGTGYGNLVVSTSKNQLPAMGSRPVPFFSSMSAVYGNYSGTTDVVSGPTNGMNSYDVKMNNGSMAPGFWAGANGDLLNAEAALSSLNTGGFVDMYLWQYNLPSARGTTSLVRNSLANTDYQAILRLNADGSLLLNPTQTSAVPIPASVLLLGSGLFGVIGLKRKLS